LFTEHLVMAQTAPGRGAGGDRAGDLPDRIEALLQARLDATGAGRGIAEVAAVIGREFTIDVLEATLEGLGPRSPLHPDGVQPALRLLERAGLVEQDGVDRMRFGHSLVRDAAYAMQLRSERPARHRAVAEAITALRGSDAEPEALAYHHEQAGDRHLAAAAHLRAATNAANLAEFGLALTHLRCATDLVADQPGAAARRLELTACMQIGAAYAASFSYFQPEAVDAYRRALELCDVIAEEEGDDPGLLLPVIAALGGLWSKEVVAGDMIAAALVTDRLERVLDKADGLDPEVHRFSLSCRGLELLYQGRTSQAIATLRNAALLGHAGPISVSLGTPHDFVAANDGILAVALTVCGDDDGADAALEEAMARTRELAFPIGPFSEAVVQLYAAYLHRLRRDVDGARAASERVGAIGDQYGFQEHSMLGQMLTLVAATVGGDEASRGALGMTLTAWKMAGGGLAVPVLLCELAEAHLAAGDLDAARQVLDEASAMVEETDQRAAEPEIHRLRALADAKAGAPEATVVAALVTAAQVGLAQGSVRLAARSVADLRDLGGGALPAAAADVARRLRAQIPATARGELRELGEWLSAQD
jgi:tetratricopeptide (TPR) repeat protein